MKQIQIYYKNLPTKWKTSLKQYVEKVGKKTKTQHKTKGDRTQDCSLSPPPSAAPANHMTSCMRKKADSTFVCASCMKCSFCTGRGI